MKRFWPAVAVLFILSLMFFPVIVEGKIPLNGRHFVSFFSPWYWERFPGFPAGVPNKPNMLDQLRQFYPYMALTQWSYQHGQLPLWNPYNFAGNPHAGEWQSSVFYPFQFLLAFLPLPIFWTLYQMTGFFLAALFTYWYLRNLDFLRSEAFFGAVTFMLSGFMVSWTMGVFVSPHTILWLPLILLSVDKITRSVEQKTINTEQKAKSNKLKIMWWMIGLTSTVFSILAGFWQTTFYVMLVSMIYSGYRARIRFKKRLILLLCWPIVAMLLVSFYVFPAMELFSRSSRVIINSGEPYQQFLLGYLLPLQQLATLFIPDYFGHPTTQNYFAPISGGGYYEQVIYIGILPILLAFIALFAKFRSVSDIQFWFILSIISASFAFDTPWARLLYSLKVPLLSTSTPNRILFVLAFGFSVLSAFGLSFVREKKHARSVTRAICTMGLCVLLLLIITTIFRTNRYITSLRNSVIPLSVFTVGSTVLFLLSQGRSNRYGQLVILTVLVVHVGQLLYQYHKFTPFSEKQFIFPDHPTLFWLKNNAGINRFTGYNGKFLPDNLATYYRIFSTDGYDTLNDRKRSQLIASSKTGNLLESYMTASDAVLNTDLTNPRTLRLMSLFGVRYLVDHPEWLDIGPTGKFPRLLDDKQKLVFSDRDWRIWEYLDVYPRAFLSGDYEVIAGQQEALDRLYEREFNPRETLLLSENVPQSFHIAQDKQATVDVVLYLPTKIEFHTRSTTDQLLFLSDTWYPGWHAALETREKLPILTAFTALRAVPVPAGEHIVTMWYFPNSLRNGLVVASMTAIFITLGLVYNWKHYA